MVRRLNCFWFCLTSRTRFGLLGSVLSSGDLVMVFFVWFFVVDDFVCFFEDFVAVLLADFDGFWRCLHDLERSRVALLSERDDLVRAARALGITWPVLTTALGVSRQALLRPRP